VIVRFEGWGAWVKLESTAAVVAIDREGVRALGLDGGNVWSAPPAVSAPIEVHLAVTARCGAGCKGCYLDARPDGVEPERQALEATLEALRDAGVFTVAFGGGEPTTRDDIAELADAARARGLTPVLTTSGLGLSETRMQRLRSFEQVNVSYDGASEAYSEVRGFDGAPAAERAIEKLAAAGVRVGVNVVLTRQSFPHLEQTLVRARELGACEGQLLRYKPAGRAASIDYLARRMTSAQRRDFAPTLRRLSGLLGAQRDFSLRIDCALTPLLSTDADIMSEPSRLSRFGVFGCEAGASLAAVTVGGRVAPCSFARATDLHAVDLPAGYAADTELERWRSFVESPPEPCFSCAIRRICKGGCKVVSTFVSGAHGPDPECPRVESHRAGLA
jgi:radical SAM protein with 4Fe4S-binding SPASM domain